MTPEEARRWLKEGMEKAAYLNCMLAVHCKPSPQWTTRISRPAHRKNTNPNHQAPAHRVQGPFLMAPKPPNPWRRNHQ